MRKWGRGGLFAGAAMAAGLVLGAAETALAKEGFDLLPGGGPGGFVPVLISNGGAFCGPCEPGPVVTRAAPGSAVLAHRYRWSPEERRFYSVGVDEVGVTDHQGELRFTIPNAEFALDKLVVSVGDFQSNAMLFLTVAGCGGPRLCPLPRRLHAFTHASAFVPGQSVIATVTGAEPKSALDIAQEEYVVEGDTVHWIPTGDPLRAEVDVFGRATVILTAAEPGVYRAIGRDRATGEESSLAIFEVGGRPR